jgi:arginine:agmatine antiporter
VRTVPRATLLGVAGAALVYLSACTLINGVLPADVLAGSHAPFADLAGRMFGASMGVVVAAFAALRAGGALGGWMLVTAESGRLAVNVQHGDSEGSRPLSKKEILANASLLVGITLLMSSSSLTEQFSAVINAAVVLMLCVYALSAAALLKFERAGARSLWIRLLAILGVILALGIIALQPLSDLLPIAGMMAVTLIWWEIIRRRQRVPA